MQREGREELERGELRKELARVLAGVPDRVERRHANACCPEQPGVLLIRGIGQVEGNPCLVLVCPACGVQFGSRSAHYAYIEKKYHQLPHLTYWSDSYLHSITNVQLF